MMLFHHLKTTTSLFSLVPPVPPVPRPLRGAVEVWEYWTVAVDDEWNVSAAVVFELEQRNA